MTQGIHHITCISSDAQKTYNFYCKLLGLRLLKKTVNYDAPDTYHLYFGNESGTPGTILTFFPFQPSMQGMHGSGMANKITFVVPKNSLTFWQAHLYNKLVKVQAIQNMYHQQELSFADNDGQLLSLIEEDTQESPWKSPEIPEQFAIRSIYSIELAVENCNKTKEVLELLGYALDKESLSFARFINNNATQAKYIDIRESVDQSRGISGAGTVHHVAFRVQNRQIQEEVKQMLTEKGFNPTPIIDRQYFTSVYFREPNSILFEIATDDPGFVVDENIVELGKTLKLPTQYEPYRITIEKQLPSLKT